MCYQKTFRNHDNLNCDRIFRAKGQLSLISLNRTAALPAALSNLTRPMYMSEVFSTALCCCVCVCAVLYCRRSSRIVMYAVGVWVLAGHNAVRRSGDGGGGGTQRRRRRHCELPAEVDRGQQRQAARWRRTTARENFRIC